jgi:hypothetical protein
MTMSRTRALTALAAVGVTAGAFLGPGAASAAPDAASLTKCFGTQNTPYTDLRYSATWSGTTEVDVKVYSTGSAIRSESYFQVLRNGTISDGLKYPNRTALGNDGFTYNNPIDRPGVTAVQFMTYVGPDSDRWLCEFSIARS